MPRTENVPRWSEGFSAGEQQRAAAAPTAAPAPATHHHALQVGGAGAYGVTVKEEEEVDEEEETLEGQRHDRLAPAPEFAREPASGLLADVAAAPAPAPNHHAPPGGAGPGASGVTSWIKMEEGAEETLAQQRDRLALALARGPVRVDSHVKVEDTDGEETDRDGEGEAEAEVGPGGEEGDVEGGLLLLAGAAHVPGDDGARGGAARRSTPTDRAARAKRGRGDVPDVPVVPAPKRRS